MTAIAVRLTPAQDLPERDTARAANATHAPLGTLSAVRTAPVVVRLQIADPLTAAGLRRWLRDAPQLRRAEDADDADVVVLAPAPMPVAWLRRTVTATRGEAPSARIVVVVDERSAVTAEDLDADVVVTRSALTPQTFQAAVTALLDEHPAADDDTDADGPADARAATVLGMLADGHDLAEIAAALFYSERTVKNVLYGYLGTVGARNRVHAVACAIRAGLV